MFYERCDLPSQGKFYITQQQIKLESCSNPPKTREVLYFRINFFLGGLGLLVDDVMIGVCFAVLLMTSSVDPMSRLRGSKFFGTRL